RATARLASVVGFSLRPHRTRCTVSAFARSPPSWRAARYTRSFWIDAVEDGVLDRVGVLELVDPRQRVLLAQARGQVFAGGAVQRLVEVVEQVVEGQQALRRLALRQLDVEAIEQFDLQGDQLLPAGGQGAFQGRAKDIQGFGQRAVRRLEVLLGGLEQGGGTQLGQAVRRL